MQTVRLSADFRIEIPRQVRERVELVPGQEFKVHLHGDHLLLVPVRREGPGHERRSLRKNSLAAAG